MRSPRCRHEPSLGQLAARCRPASAVILSVRTTAVVRIGEESREGHSPCRLPSAGDFEAPTGPDLPSFFARCSHPRRW